MSERERKTNRGRERERKSLFAQNGTHDLSKVCYENYMLTDIIQGMKIQIHGNIDIRGKRNHTERRICRYV